MLRRIINRVFGRALPAPPQQLERLSEFYVREDGVLACRFCGGNCGQCGNTSTLGNIGFSMETIARSSGLFNRSADTRTRTDQNR